MSNLPTIIKLPSLPTEVSIKSDWLNTRDKLVTKTQAIASVDNQDAFEDAEILLKKLTSTSNELEKQRKAMAKPFREADKTIKKTADTARNVLESEKARLKKIMADYMTEVEAKRQAEIQRQIEEEEKKRAELANSPFADCAEQEEPEQIAAETPNVRRSFSNLREVWRFEIINPHEVPREFMMIDERKIREHVNREKEATTIPGVRVWSEKTVQSR